MALQGNQRRRRVWGGGARGREFICGLHFHNVLHEVSTFTLISQVSGVDIKHQEVRENLGPFQVKYMVERET